MRRIMTRIGVIAFVVGDASYPEYTPKRDAQLPPCMALTGFIGQGQCPLVRWSPWASLRMTGSETARRVKPHVETEQPVPIFSPLRRLRVHMK